MSVLSRKEFKELLVEWRKNFISEANRVIMSNPEDFVGLNDKGLQASRVQSSFMSKEIEDMTHLSVEETLKKLISVAGENVFIHFLTSPDKLSKDKIPSDNIKKLLVNPKTNWGDQQGIFSYKLNKQGLVNLIQKGKPASGGYGVRSNYFQVFEIDDARTIKIFEKDEHVSVSLPITLYPITNRNLERKLEILIKESFNLITENKNVDNFYYSPLIKKLALLYLDALESKDFEIFTSKIKNIIQVATKKKIFKLYGNPTLENSYYLKNKKAKFFITLKFYVSFIANTIAIINNTTEAQYGSLLWHLLGVENIDDQGAGLIHSNEMSQAVSFDFSGDSLKPIGTFKNYFKNQPIGQYYEMFIDIINNENVDWDFSIVTEHFDEISDPREWDLKYLKKMLKIHNPNNIMHRGDDLDYFWNDTMEGVLWAFSEHENKDTGLLLLKYVMDNCPVLKDTATYYYNKAI